MTIDQRIKFIISNTATLVTQLTELKTLQERLREAQIVTMQQTLTPGSSDIEEFETAKYH